MRDRGERLEANRLGYSDLPRALGHVIAGTAAVVVVGVLLVVKVILE
jgi:hypothetical protein